MRRLPRSSFITFSIVALAALARVHGAAPDAASQALIGRYCTTCHNDRLRTGNLVLDPAGLSNVASNSDQWEKVVRKLRSRAMPPAGAPRPAEADYVGLQGFLETSLDAAASASPNPGRTADFHRLNRAEYTNAVRDLLSVQIDGPAMLPDDDADYGFDNVGDALSVSPVLMERYLAVAEQVSRLAVGDPQLGVALENYAVPDTFMQDDRMGEDLPIGSRGGFAARHNFSLDGEYVAKIRLQRGQDGYIRGLLDQVHPLEIRVDGKRVARFEVGGVRRGETGPIHSRIGGQYRFDAAQMNEELNGDARLEARFRATAGNHLLQVFFLKRNTIGEGLLDYYPTRPMEADLVDFKRGDPRIKTVSVAGPFNPDGQGDTASRRKIFICHAGASAAAPGDDAACAAKILSSLARRAYRRPVNQRDLGSLMKLYSAGAAAGGFEAGVQHAIQGILVNPKFLFRSERDAAGIAAGAAYAVSEIELASRLSFFLWSSIPDEQLLELAETGKLRQPEVLRNQVRRMLADPRSETLVKNFAAQWLFLRNLDRHVPDGRAFPDFDDELRTAFEHETELFLRSMILEDRPVTALLDADYTFMNERLALHYGVPNILGANFRRVKLSDDQRRGLLGQGSILTITSRPNRTSPVLRGKWVLSNLLGATPPPPPPDVPALAEKPRGGKPLSMRQRMDEHRANPACASCHAQMDPIGFALENFDATGRWRSNDGGVAIDSSGALPSGGKFAGVAELRKMLLSRPEVFAHNITEKLLTYSLGRGAQQFDQPAIRRIVREAAVDDYRWSSLILGIVSSQPFQMRRAKSS